MTPLGSRVVPDVNPTTAGASGSTGSGPSMWSSPSAESNGSAPAGRSRPSPTTSQVGGRSSSETSAAWVARCSSGPNGGCGHENFRLHRAEDVADLLLAVEVDDGHDDGTEVGGRPERDAGLQPVRELEHEHVARPDAPRAERGRQRTRRLVDVGEGAAPRAELRVDVERHVTHGIEPGRHHVAQPVVGPPPLGDVPLGERAPARSAVASRRSASWSLPVVRRRLVQFRSERPLCRIDGCAAAHTRGCTHPRAAVPGPPAREPAPQLRARTAEGPGHGTI